MILRRVSDGARVRLGPELGRGGEGAVYPVIGQGTDNSRVAKIYSKAPTPAKVEKLRVMTRAATPALLRVAAWPVDLLEDENHRVRGFLMPRVAAREDAHQLYSPKSRRRAFQHADFRFIVRAATNVARAFAQVHEAGHVIGDVNHGNALIGHDATVVLIDCDSFQVRDPAGRMFTCDVGVPLFTAPELQDAGFRGLKRSARHDAFGLAVLVFHMLFLGRHPYAGLYEGGEMPIERAIAESRFAYGAGAEARGMRAPPATLPLGAFGPWIAALFERAFAPVGDAARPAASEWVDALEALERDLIECAVSSTHFHPRGVECCLCAVEKKSGVRLFGAISVSALGQEALESLWSAIRAVRKPSKDRLFSTHPKPNSPVRVPKPPRWSRKSVRSEWKVFVTVFGIYGLLLVWSHLSVGVLSAALFGGWVAYLGSRAWRAMRFRALRKLHAFRNDEVAWAEREWRRLVTVWDQQCSFALFDRELQRLRQAQLELASWDARRRGEMRRLRREHESRARELHLAQFSIDRAHFRLNPADVATLASFGFETAADVVRRLPELVKVLEKTKAMDIQAWARGLSAKFQFERKAPPDPMLVAEVEQLLADRQRELQAMLRGGPDKLELMRRQIEDARARMEPVMDAAAKELRAVRAAAKAVSGQ